MDKTAYEVENSLNAYYNIKSNRKLLTIPMREILFFEILDHDLIVHTVAGTFKQRKTISELKSDLPGQFVQIGRSHIVNVLQVDRIMAKETRLRDGTALPIAPKYSSVLYEAFLNMR
jgi:DNA-binding LytR/AlgR family response regulator